MELRQLEYLVAVAEEANFTRAAARVHISQSGVSAQIRQLERELGATLFDRSGRRVTPTAAGEAALVHARAALAAVHAVRAAVDDHNGLVRGRLRVGMVTGCTITPLFDALAALHRAHPGVDVVLTEAASDELVAWVRDGTLDLALVGVAGAPPDDLGSSVIVQEGLVAVVAADHPLARRRQTTVADVCGHPVLCLPPGTGIRTAFDRACAAHGLAADLALEASAPEAVLDLAGRGFGVAVLSASMAADRGEELRSIPIRDAAEPALLALVWTRELGPATRAALHHLRDAFAGP